MAIETTTSGRKVYACDVCGHVWIRRAPGEPQRCTGPIKHVRWNYKAREATPKEEKQPPPAPAPAKPKRRIRPAF